MHNLKKILILTLLFVLMVAATEARNKIKYPVAAIPKELLSGANAVLRTREDIYERKSEKRAVRQIHYAVTVLNKSGQRQGIFVQPYTKFSSVSAIKAIVYDKNGKKVKVIKPDQILDVVGDLGTALYSDTRFKYIDPDYEQYPFTVEYSCEVTYNGTLNLPSWQTFSDYKLAIQEEHFTMIAANRGDHNPSLAIRYYANRKDIHVKEEEQDGKTYYHYDVKNLKALRKERYSPNLADCSPTVYFAPAEFSIAGYNGGFRSWEDFGAFIRQLNKGRDVLPEATQKKIGEMIASKQTTREKVDMLYRYMQDKVRYVSISKGIQGWQPMEAKKVDELSYGDCKALTNYMKSLLNVAGIKSYYTLVDAGVTASPLITSFPSNRFNHAILCVPLKGDTLWLECTNQHIPCGYLGDFTDDRNVLIIGDTTVTLGHTKVYGATENIKSRKTEVSVRADGTCDMNINILYSGMFYDDILSLMLSSDKKQRQALLRTIHLPTFQLKKYTFSEEKQALPLIRSSMEITAPHYGTSIGNSLMLNLFPFLQNGNANIRYRRRRSEIIIRRSYTGLDTVVFHLPGNFVATKLPPAKNITTEFGSYSFTVTKQNNEIVFVRKLVVNKGKYPPSKDEEFLDFLGRKADLDNVKLILVKRL